jgi:Na+/glutamate symporter
VGKVVAQLLAGSVFELPTFVCVLFIFEGGRRHLIVRRPVRRGRVFHQVTRHRAADQAADR